MWRVTLTAFILSPTPYDAARRTSWIADHTRDELAGEHVLFQEGDYVGSLWARIATRS